MTTDTQPLAPTDAELDELRQANSGRLNFVTFREFRVIARAVLAKWGARQPVECEPMTDEQLWANDEIMSLNADLGWHMETIRMFARAIERAHGIKGGQHGAE